MSIQKIAENMTGAAVADLLFANDLELETKVNTVSALNALTIVGAQLLDKSLLISGSSYTNATGAVGANNSYMRYPLLKLKANTSYTLSGMYTQFMGGLYDAAGARITKFNELTSTIYTSLAFTTGANNIYLGVNVSSDEVATPNRVINTVMLAEGANTNYEPYRGLLIKGEAISGDVYGYPSGAVVSAAVSAVSSNTKGIEIVVDNYATFTGASKKPLGQDYTLNSVGDYIQFTAACTGVAPDGTLGLFGTPKTTAGPFTNNVGFFSGTQLTIRQSSGAYLNWTVPSIVDFNTYEIRVTASGWQASINGAVLSTIAKTDALIISTIGDAYAAAGWVGKLKSLKIHTATKDLTLTEFETGATGVTQTLAKKADPLVLPISGRAVYVSYSPTGYVAADNNGANGKEAFSIFVKYGASSVFYQGYQVAHVLDLAGAHSDLWRIIKCDKYKLIDGQMVPQNVVLLTLGESESVYQVDGKADASGGYHGDELLSAVYFYIDGVRLTAAQLTAAFPLKGCEAFSYEQKSNILAFDTQAIECGHLKQTIFSKSGFTTRNTLTWVGTPLVSIWYSGILCTAIAQAKTYYTELLNYVNNSLTGVTINETGPHEMFSFNEDTGLSCRVSSRITKATAASVNVTESYDAQGFTVVFETSGRSKYYRQLRAVRPSAGDIWQSLQTVEMFCKD